MGGQHYLITTILWAHTALGTEVHHLRKKETPKRKILLPSAVHLEERLTVSHPAVP